VLRGIEYFVIPRLDRGIHIYRKMDYPVKPDNDRHINISVTCGKPQGMIKFKKRCDIFALPSSKAFGNNSTKRIYPYNQLQKVRTSFLQKKRGLLQVPFTLEIISSVINDCGFQRERDLPHAHAHVRVLLHSP
jgi:hypothetical protein